MKSKGHVIQQDVSLFLFCEGRLPSLNPTSPLDSVYYDSYRATRIPACAIDKLWQLIPMHLYAVSIMVWGFVNHWYFSPSFIL